MSEQRSISGSFKICATCALWAGFRGVNASRNFVNFVADSAGECCGGGFDHTKTRPYTTCSKFQKWSVLK